MTVGMMFEHFACIFGKWGADEFQKGFISEFTKRTGQIAHHLSDNIGPIHKVDWTDNRSLPESTMPLITQLDEWVATQIKKTTTDVAA